jgi:micrococcal nuclease
MKLLRLATFFVIPILVLSLFGSTAIAANQPPLFKVLRVVDGDTIVVDVRGNKETVRLLGIDTPETVDPRKPVQCFGKAASDKMKSLVAGKSVILVDEKTQGNRDVYKRLLRYVYLPDSVRTFVNGEMVKQGYAFSYRQYPTKMLDKFNNFEKYAREHNLGLWSSCPLSATPISTPRPKTVTYPAPIYTQPTTVYIPPATQVYTAPAQTNTEPIKSAPVDQQNSGNYSCNCSKTCTQISSCAEAQYQLTTCGCAVRDGDKDGIACDGAPLHCQN